MKNFEKVWKMIGKNGSTKQTRTQVSTGGLQIKHGQQTTESRIRQGCLKSPSELVREHRYSLCEYKRIVRGLSLSI
jgi:ABC-type hemin transport system ATPase subunit